MQAPSSLSCTHICRLVTWVTFDGVNIAVIKKTRVTSLDHPPKRSAKTELPKNTNLVCILLFSLQTYVILSVKVADPATCDRYSLG